LWRTRAEKELQEVRILNRQDKTNNNFTFKYHAGHWKESVYKNELMTGYVSDQIFAPMSSLTVRSFADLGYIVDVTKADPYTVPAALKTNGHNLRAFSQNEINQNKIDNDIQLYGDDILKIPLVVLPTLAPTNIDTSPMTDKHFSTRFVCPPRKKNILDMDK